MLKGSLDTKRLGTPTINNQKTTTMGVFFYGVHLRKNLKDLFKLLFSNLVIANELTSSLFVCLFF